MNGKITNMMFLVSSYEPHDPNKFHGKSPDKSLVPVFYKDNSLTKESNLKQNFIKKCKETESKLKLLKIQSEKVEKAKKARIFQEKVEEIVSTANLMHKASLLKLNQSATVIQKHVKGFLVRKDFEDKYIDYKETQLNALTADLQKLTFKSFMALGTNTLPAILKIQKFYRRCCFNYRISKLTEFYQVFTAIKTKNAEDHIKSALQVIISRIKKQWQVKISNRTKVLRKVRRALAIITIANYWKKKKLTKKSFREKILRAKRRFLAIKARETYQKNLKSEEDAKNSFEDDFDQLLDNEQRQKHIKKKQEREARLKKIHDSKLSHGIENIKLNSFMPLLQPPSVDSPDESNHKMMIEPTFGFLQKVNKRVGSLNTRCTQLTNPVKVTHKRLQSENLPNSLWLTDSTHTTPWPAIKIPTKVQDQNFLKNTLSFKAKKDQVTDEKIPKTILNHPRQKYLKKDTVSFSLKIRKAYHSPSKQFWDISNRSDSVYTPSLYSSSFTPSPYKNPKNSLIPPNQPKSSNKNINQCSSSILTVQISTQEASTIDLFHLNNS